MAASKQEFALPPMPKLGPSVELKTYHGNCHCAAFKFRVAIPELMTVNTCDCSYCSRKAHQWIFPISKEALIIERGSIDDLSKYQFNEKNITYHFCKRCGSNLLFEFVKAPPDVPPYGVNARMLRDVDLEILQHIQTVAGPYGAPYVPPQFPERDETLNGQKVYNGCCHCKAVTYSVVWKPEEDIEVLSCNCSLCRRNGELYIYPKTSAVTVHTGLDKFVEYDFLSKESLHTFCKECGCSVLVRVLDDRDPVCPVNVRNFISVDVKALKVKKYDGWSKGSPYVVK